MATEERAIGDSQPQAPAPPSEYSAVRPRRRAEPVDFDSILAPTCMIWAMFIGLGVVIITIILWILSTGLRMI